VNMLMEIDPLSMRGSLVMTMASISPSRRDVSPAEQLRRSPRLVPPRFRLMAAEFRLMRVLMIYFFQGKRPHIAEDGHRRPPGGPRERGERPVGGRAPHPPGQGVGPSGTFFTQYFFIYSKNMLREVSGLLELCRIGL